MLQFVHRHLGVLFCFKLIEEENGAHPFSALCLSRLRLVAIHVPLVIIFDIALNAEGVSLLHILSLERDF